MSDQLSREEEWLRSQINHPVGRQYEPIDDDPVSEVIGLIVCMLGVGFLVAFAALIGWNIAGAFGAIVAAIASVWMIVAFVRSLL